MTGIQAFLEILASAGVRHIFGNPGTTELPLNDALAADPRFQYIFGLQEIPVVAMADGFAQASGQVGVANVHISCGLGNAMGMLYNAHIEGTPLLLTAGQQDRRLSFSEPVLIGDLVSVARPWTKWAHEVGRVEDVPSAVRRAIQTALTPPTGPVFLALPVDVQSQQRDDFDLASAHVPDRRVRPPVEALQRAARILSEARNPVILAGSRVTESGACADLAALAEALGAPVFAENATMHGRLPIAADHPLYSGTLPLYSDEIRDRLSPFDVLFAVGLPVMRLYIHREPACPLPPGVRLVQMDNDPWQIGKNFAVEVGLVGDIRCGLSELTPLLQLSPERQQLAKQRIEESRERREAERSAIEAESARQRNITPMTPLTLMSTLARTLPANTAVVEEAITTHGNLLEKLGFFRDPTGHFAHRGWALGWGLGCAIGVKLAWSDRPVVALLGDGSALYGIQGLWTAAHHRIPVTFIICNNTEYKILKVCGDLMPLPRMHQKEYLAMDITSPAIDFVGLARAFGVEARRVSNADELADRLQESVTAGDRPQLLEVPIAR